MLRVNQLTGFGSGGRSIRYGGVSGSSFINGAYSSYTWNSCNIGDPAPDRAVFVYVRQSDSAAYYGVNAVTVNGVAGVEATDFGGADTAWYTTSNALYAAMVPAGSSVSIAVTASESIANYMSIYWAVFYGLASAAAFAGNSWGKSETLLSKTVGVNTPAKRPGLALGATWNSGSSDPITSITNATMISFPGDENTKLFYEINPPQASPRNYTINWTNNVLHARFGCIASFN
jgi:hypothetical protein